ncbi:MAG: TfoX/Sxy family protein [Bosea sp. (in: a-proteobacteria)]
MNTADIQDVFGSVIQVRCRRMFGGFGIYDGERIFGLSFDGEIFLKTDEHSCEAFRAAGSRPFTYEKGGKVLDVAYGLLPEAARDDDDALRAWVRLALQAAERSALAKAAIKPRPAAPPSRPR